MSYLKGRSGRIYYENSEVSDRPWLMLANSLGSDISMWDSQFETFSRHFNVLRYDVRGHGRSSVPPEPYSIHDLGRDALELLDGLGIQRAHVCGLSMGGMIGQWLGIHAGERVASLTLCCTAAQIGSRESWDQRIEIVERDGMVAVLPEILRRWFTEPFLDNNPSDMAHARTMLEATSPLGYAACCAALRDADFRSELRLITAPTLVVFGAADLVTTGVDAEILAKGIPKAQMLKLDAAHLANVEAAPQFTRGVLEFLLNQLPTEVNHG